MKLRIETFRDSSSRLRAKLFCDGRLVSVKPAERVCDGAPQEERHQYNLFKLFGLYFPDMPAEDRLRLLAGEEVVRCERCGVEIWEDAECDCGVDCSDHEGLDEAYANKREAE